MLTLGRLFNKDFEVAQFPDGSFLSPLFKILRNSSSVFSSALSLTSKASASSPNSKCLAARLRICPKQRNRHSTGLIGFAFFSEFIFEEGVHSCHCGIVVRGIVKLEITNLLADTVFFDNIEETSRNIRAAVFTDNLRKADESI